MWNQSSTVHCTSSITVLYSQLLCPKTDPTPKKTDCEQNNHTKNDYKIFKNTIFFIYQHVPTYTRTILNVSRLVLKVPNHHLSVYVEFPLPLLLNLFLPSFWHRLGLSPFFNPLFCTTRGTLSKKAKHPGGLLLRKNLIFFEKHSHRTTKLQGFMRCVEIYTQKILPFLVWWQNMGFYNILLFAIVGSPPLSLLQVTGSNFALSLPPSPPPFQPLLLFFDGEMCGALRTFLERPEEEGAPSSFFLFSFPMLVWCFQYAADE